MSGIIVVSDDKLRRINLFWDLLRDAGVDVRVKAGKMSEDDFARIRKVLAELATAARPIDLSDFGSERQVEAENAFFVAVEIFLDDEIVEELERFALHATPDDRIDAALLQLREYGP